MQPTCGLDGSPAATGKARKRVRPTDNGFICKALEKRCRDFGDANFPKFGGRDDFAYGMVLAVVLKPSARVSSSEDWIGANVARSISFVHRECTRAVDPFFWIGFDPSSVVSRERQELHQCSLILVWAVCNIRFT